MVLSRAFYRILRLMTWWKKYCSLLDFENVWFASKISVKSALCLCTSLFLRLVSAFFSFWGPYLRPAGLPFIFLLRFLQNFLEAVKTVKIVNFIKNLSRFKRKMYRMYDNQYVFITNIQNYRYSRAFLKLRFVQRISPIEWRVGESPIILHEPIAHQPVRPVPYLFRICYCYNFKTCSKGYLPSCCEIFYCFLNCTISPGRKFLPLIS